ncbi:DUF2690 domain-containing protein [Streptomyces sp. NPDC018031]|uniref:XRE family transcriptional regulator n=1 Tax=Streptomyces sp. NPDC018031 TaxID=3365033 RepID=UPI00378BFCAD
MPRWRELPEELDPQLCEFTGRLRALVDRNDLSVAAVADRTGYSKTSWERFLNGRLLPPRPAVEALAEVTGTDAEHLTTLWELAERAWSRSEMRNDVTMEAIRTARAKEAVERARAAADKPDGRAGRGDGRGGSPRQDRTGGPADGRSAGAESGAVVETENEMEPGKRYGDGHGTTLAPEAGETPEGVRGTGTETAAGPGPEPAPTSGAGPRAGTGPEPGTGPETEIAAATGAAPAAGQDDADGVPDPAGDRGPEQPADPGLEHPADRVPGSAGDRVPEPVADRAPEAAVDLTPERSSEGGAPEAAGGRVPEGSPEGRTPEGSSEGGAPEAAADRVPEQPADRASDRAPEATAGRVPEQPADRASDRAPEAAVDRAPEPAAGDPVRRDAAGGGVPERPVDRAPEPAAGDPVRRDAAGGGVPERPVDRVPERIAEDEPDDPPARMAWPLLPMPPTLPAPGGAAPGRGADGSARGLSGTPSAPARPSRDPAGPPSVRPAARPHTRVTWARPGNDTGTVAAGRTAVGAEPSDASERTGGHARADTGAGLDIAARARGPRPPHPPARPGAGTAPADPTALVTGPPPGGTAAPRTGRTAGAGGAARVAGRSDASSADSAPPAHPADPAAPGDRIPGAARRPPRSVAAAAVRRVRGRASAKAVAAAAAVGAGLLVLSGVLLLGGDGDDRPAKASPPARSSEPLLPPGVKCTGRDCAGKDPEAMGCGDDRVQTTADAMVGNAYIEVRYSAVCGAAWARIAHGSPGDEVRVARVGEGGGSRAEESDRVGTDGGAYTRMLAVPSSDEAEACVTLAGGESGCTRPVIRP